MNQHYRIFNLLYIAGILIISMDFEVVVCEVVQPLPCYSSSSNNSCELVTMSLDPCPEVLENEICRVFRGTDISWTFVFIPKFSADNVTLQAYSYTPILDIPYPGQDRNGCKFTNCPFIRGEQRILTYNTSVLLHYPAAPFTVKWRLWNEKNEECCWMLPILIV